MSLPIIRPKSPDETNPIARPGGSWTGMAPPSPDGTKPKARDQTKPKSQWGVSRRSGPTGPTRKTNPGPSVRLALALSLLLAGPVLADELDDQIKLLAPQLDDRKVSVADRERLATEIATNLDAAALAAPTPEARRARWVEAATVLDRFRDRNPGHPGERAFALQAAVYRWAEAQSWNVLAESQPADPAPKARAIEALDAAIARLGPIAGGAGRADDPLAQGARYRLARALADRAKLVVEGAKGLRGEALGWLDPPIREPALKGFAILLRAELLTDLGEYDRASADLDASAHADPAPSPLERLEVGTRLLVARQRFDEASRAIEAATMVEDSARARLAFRVALARFQDLPRGPARSTAEADVFRKAEALRAAGTPEGRAALAALAAAIEEPGPGLGPESWDALAEGQAILGHPDRAGALAAAAAEKAQALGHRERAVALRRRAAAFLFQAGSFARADALLTRIVDDPKAGEARPKAGLMRILARAKLLEQGGGDAKAAASAYLAALEGQIRDFPREDGADEARWRLGKARIAAGDREKAVGLWSDIAHSSPRWLAARLVVLDLLEGDLDAPLLNDDLAEARHVMDEAQRLLDRASAEAGDGPERAEVELRRALLDLIPEVGHPETALAACDRLARSAGRDPLRDRARRLRIVALAQLGRAVDAEREARVESTAAPFDELLDLCARLDRSARASESELARRRMGGIVRTLLAPILAKRPEITPARRAEAALRLARARFFGGDPDGARKTLTDAAIDPEALDDRLLSDLADQYAELDAHAPAADAYRLLARRREPGSIPWLAARFGQALAYSRSNRPREARQLIDGTAILHPDLGGGGLRNKFEHLRGRLSGGEPR